MKKLKELLKDDSAQGMLEYVLILAVVIAIGLVFKDKIKTAITGKAEDVGKSIGDFQAQ